MVRGTLLYHDDGRVHVRGVHVDLGLLGEIGGFIRSKVKFIRSMDLKFEV